MAARRLPSLLPPLEGTEALETSRIHSLAGKLDRSRGLLRRPPFRTPHHSASREGLIGGGAGLLQPGEVSLAHHGLLLLDEAAEFNANVLQALREPLEQNRVELARAGRRAFFPANFMLVLTLNPCPCGNLGREEGICLCSPREIHRYWRGLGGALLDRIVIRVAMEPLSPEALIRGERSSSADLREELSIGREFRRSRKGRSELSPRGEEMLIGLVRDRGYSNRAVEGVRAVARTIADLKGSFPVGEEEIFEAGELRSFGENLYYSGERIPAGR